jgi:DNA processing protein
MTADLLSTIVWEQVFRLLWGMENFEEKACLCALNRIFGFEPKIALALIGHLGSASEVFRLKEDELELLTGPYFKYKGRICSAAADMAAEELHRMENKGIHFCGWTQESYPPLLKECEDAPVGLYIRSVSSPETLWNTDNCISIVGTRDISPYGREWCGKIVRELSRSPSKPCIVSGLALGTDIEAHRAALDAGLPTIGVMATGPDSIYPYRNRETAERMANTPGCALITDYPPGTGPLALHFLRRNRIIAGLSKATILIESKIRGGGMMTCRTAFSYNRDVYALPGRIDDLRSQGCNLLIRQKIAEPIESVPALPQSLGMKAAGSRNRITDRERLQMTFHGTASEECIERMSAIMQIIRRDRGISMDELAMESGLGYRVTAETAGLLELEGFITIDLLQRCCINHKNV